ncbi:MAG: hypothetical protein QXJ32_00670 [Thermoplasmata archaeon]
MRFVRSCALVLVAIAIAAFSTPAVAADLNISTGDWWEYEVTAEIPEIDVTPSGTVKMEVKDKVQETVMGQIREVFVLDMVGSASFSGTYMGFAVSANMTFTGEIHRLASNFSMSSMQMVASMDMVVTGMTMSMSMGMESDYEPVMNDYLGDEDLTVGALIHSHSSATSSTWVNMMGTNETGTSTDEVDLTMQVVASDVEVSTPAGTFKCYKVLVTGETTDEPNLSTTYYYSDEVGNFVKVEGDGDIATGFSSMTLKAYSRGGGLSSAATILVIGLAVAAVVVVAIALMLMRGRRRTPSPVPPPQPGPEPYMPPPPPPPPGQ